MKKLTVTLIALVYSCMVLAQKNVGPPILLENMDMQVVSTHAVNNMYNFKFAEAESEFRWFKFKYPDHPLPYFLMGLSTWWKIMPNEDNEEYDATFLAYMDTSITKADKLYEENEENTEASFFLAAAYAFKGRLYSDRKDWGKAAWASRNALKYLEKSRSKGDLSPEFLFGDGLYNYYRDWIPENFPALKTILWLFPKGNKEEGIKQLKEVSNNAFYTRTEAQYHLMRIYSVENQLQKAYELSKYLHETFPDNAYFHRYYARSAYAQGRIPEVEKESRSILEKIDQNMPGYEAVSGRYASYYLGYIEYQLHKNTEVAKSLFKKAVAYSELSKAYESAYYHSALITLGKIYYKEENLPEAKKYLEVVVKRAEKKSDQRKEAERYLKDIQKKEKEQRKEERRQKRK
ncbi:tetratricopeptide repeat protein [Cytophagaceae bacterium YF14B1]|uniref:Tetratricopeptide repeat protein n=1 Tax=Xanthocytophaga flava TaxID=3048013 RepID=A0AAE3U7P7_9BACT|nr:tetratricopeptide repeat protein [Xanthocytophaga flavus]MDJ1480348.1 tetratricopeptide repeat protein [Xanthocytophaga flavus]